MAGDTVNNKSTQDWQFWIDRGGTFTDIIGKSPKGELKVAKMLSENPSRYQDAAIAGIASILDIDEHQLQNTPLNSIKMGTTVATNALLERQGEPTVLITTQGFADLLRIGNQNRPHLFKLNIERPELLYTDVIEAVERISAHGKTITPLDSKHLQTQLQQKYQQGYRSCAILFMHSFKYPEHEQQAAQIAKQIGFAQISVSSQVSPLMKMVGRGDTSVVDAYLTPVLKRYVEQFTAKLTDSQQVQFMQSNGGLTEAHNFEGKDAILSGPAGGVVAMVETAKQAGFKRIVGLDMGGTSTDVALYDGQYERTFDTEVAGIRLQAPMMDIHTVAAGGGSILSYDGQGMNLRLNVGPESAGANPGPTAYRNQGPLAVTDINLYLGKLQADFFPAIFGQNHDQTLDLDAVRDAFDKLNNNTSHKQSQQKPEQLAQGYLDIAVEHMANAIKHISVQKGIDISQFTLCCFGGAGAQHACLVADSLGIKSVFVHQLSSVLSAYGMGLAKVRELKVQAIEQPFDQQCLNNINNTLQSLNQQVTEQLSQQGFNQNAITLLASLQLKYQGTDSTLSVNIANRAINIDDIESISNEFAKLYHHRYGFMSDKNVEIEAIQIEGVGESEQPIDNSVKSKALEPLPNPCATRPVYFKDQQGNTWQDTPFYRREKLSIGQKIQGPAVVIEPQTTIVVEPNWQLEITNNNDALLTAKQNAQANEQAGLSTKTVDSTQVDPARLELFNNLFMFIAEQMGFVLQNTASSVNIKERLDFSCALFNRHGELVANAPHMPVHLGSMGESVTSVAEQNKGTMQPGDVYLINSPYHGGSHLPDLTVVTPVFDDGSKQIEYYVASRGHHADIGGITPGSMPAQSQHIEQEGILFSNFLLVHQGKFQYQALEKKLTEHRYPARNIAQNIADLKAQIAANQKGIELIRHTEQQHSKATIAAYMDHMLDAAQSSVKQAIGALSSGSYTVAMDGGNQIKVAITVKDDHATVDFTGSSEQKDNNFNAPYAVVKAAVLYVFRTLVTKDIPLNAGCLRPVTIIIPEGSMLNPQSPAAVVAGNVETSQAITDALYAALNISAASQGTMNNFSFGNEQVQYYETICGGTGASIHGPGCDAVQSHMTNSRITDPEVLEWRYPVTLVQFAIRKHSAGKGELNGGNGVIRQVRFEQPMDVTILSNRRQNAPFGLNGGKDASKGETIISFANGQQKTLNSCESIKLKAGDSIIIRTPGGGGFNH